MASAIRHTGGSRFWRCRLLWHISWAAMSSVGPVSTDRRADIGSVVPRSVIASPPKMVSDWIFGVALLMVQQASRVTDHPATHIRREAILVEHDLFGKPASTFPDHALTQRDAVAADGLVEFLGDASMHSAVALSAAATAACALWVRSAAATRAASSPNVGERGEPKRRPINARVEGPRSGAKQTTLARSKHFSLRCSM